MPLVESMLSVLRSNKSIMLDKSKRLRKTLRYNNESKNKQFDCPKASLKQLQLIKKRMKTQHKQLMKKRLLVFLMILVAPYFLFVFK